MKKWIADWSHWISSGIAGARFPVGGSLGVFATLVGLLFLASLHQQLSIGMVEGVRAGVGGEIVQVSLFGLTTKTVKVRSQPGTISRGVWLVATLEPADGRSSVRVAARVHILPVSLAPFRAPAENLSLFLGWLDSSWTALLFGAVLLLTAGRVSLLISGLTLAACTAFMAWNLYWAAEEWLSMPPSGIVVAIVLGCLLGFRLGSNSTGLGRHMQKLAHVPLALAFAPSLAGFLGWNAAGVKLALLVLALFCPVSICLLFATMILGQVLALEGIYRLLPSAAILLTLGYLRNHRTVRRYRARIRRRKWLSPKGRSGTQFGIPLMP